MAPTSDVNPARPPLSEDSGRSAPAEARRSRLDLLAEMVGLKPELLRDIARRLSEDSQVQMLRTLYQFETDEVGSELLAADAATRPEIAEPARDLAAELGEAASKMREAASENTGGGS